MKLRSSKLAAVGIVSACAVLAVVHAQFPQWWTERDVLDTNAPPTDFSPVNQGQVKYIAHQAYLEMQAAIPGGAGSEVAATIAEFLDDDNYLPANIGMVKHVATPFYDRLIEIGYTTNYPWTDSTPADFAPANIGQIKNLFAFDVALDTDGDGLPDWWEILHGLDPYSGLDDSLALWYKFDEGEGHDVLNSAADHHHGYLDGDSHPEWTSGVLGGALSFSGTGGVVRIPLSEPIITGQSFTVSAWVWFDSTALDIYPTILSDLDEACGWGYAGFHLGFDDAGAGSGAYLGDCTGYSWATDNTPINERWALISMVYDQTNLNLYVDSELKDSVAATSMAASTRTNLLIGWADHPDFSSRWKGKIDDVRLYTAALTSSQINGLYDSLHDTNGDGLTNLDRYQLGLSPSPALPESGLNRNWMYFNRPEIASPTWELVPGMWERFHMVGHESGTNTMFFLMPQNLALDSNGTNVMEVRLAWNHPAPSTNSTELWLNANLYTTTTVNVDRPFHGLPTTFDQGLDVYRFDYDQPPFTNRIEIYYSPLIKTFTNGVQTDYTFLNRRLLPEDTDDENYGANNWLIGPQWWGGDFWNRDFQITHDSVILRNPGFEDESGPDSVFHWEAFGNEAGYSTEITHDGSSRAFRAVHAGGIYQNIVVYPGEELVISAYAFTPSNTNTIDPNPLQDGRHGSLDIEYLDVPGAGGALVIHSIPFHGTNTHDQWHFLAFTSRVPNHVVSANISLRAVLPTENNGTGHVYFDNLSVIRSEDSDRDGMPDWWETLHGLDPQDPSDAIEDLNDDGLLNIEKYRLGLDPTLEDSLGDGIPDWWMVQFGLNPMDASLAFQDLDGDGLTVYQEYLAGTNPWSQDSDGDGLSDEFELYDYLSDPSQAQADFAGFILKQSIPGRDAITTLGQWSTNGFSLSAESRRGYAEYALNVSTPGIYRVEVEGRDRNAFQGWRSYELRLSLDELYLGRPVLYSQDNKAGKVSVLTPWLNAGVYTFRIYWDNASDQPRFQVDRVRLQSIPGPDLSGSGIPDWMDRRMERLSHIDPDQETSYFSPASLEGRDPFLPWMSISGAIQPQPGAGGRWYADIPLDTATPTSVVVQFQSGGRAETNHITWVPYNVFDQGDLHLRKGDTLMLSAHPPDATNGTMVLSVDGASYTSSIHGVITHTFASEGSFQITGVYHPVTGDPVPENVMVHVVDAHFPESPAAWIQTWRRWDVPDLSTNAVLNFDPSMIMVEVENGDPGRRTFQNFLYQPEPHHIVARAGPSGAILTNVAVQGFRMGSEAETYLRRIDQCRTGDRLVETAVVLSPVLEDMVIKGETLVAGVLFEDGSVSRQWSSEDFDELGELKIRFVQSAESITAACHILYVYQGTNRVVYTESGF